MFLPLPHASASLEHVRYGLRLDRTCGGQRVKNPRTEGCEEPHLPWTPRVPGPGTEAQTGRTVRCFRLLSPGFHLEELQDCGFDQSIAQRFLERRGVHGFHGPLTPPHRGAIGFPAFLGRQNGPQRTGGGAGPVVRGGQGEVAFVASLSGVCTFASERHGK